ncbi:MAG: hypothetical protein JXA10_12795 [Anaerolineae bacterium]|nr:hypothetical protein [Anaerolineae bacterium]
MSRARFIFSLMMIVIVLLSAGSLTVSAQATPEWLQVWLIPNRVDGPTIVEYRDFGGNVQARYILAADNFLWPQQAGGNVYGDNVFGSISYFSPREQAIVMVSAGLPPATEAEWYNLMRVAPTPDGSRYAYGVFLQHADWEQPATSWIYLATPGAADQLLWTEDAESYLAIAPLAWVAGGQTLLIHDMPQGIGGYILYWQYQNVRALDVATGAITALGNLDGYSADLRYTAAIEWDADFGYLETLSVTETATGIVTRYPFPDVGEAIATGGDAFFTPDNSKVAYQVARSNPENEKFWTIVIDLLTGESRIVYVEEGVNYEMRYGNIAGWLDAHTLVLGGGMGQQSAIIDVTSGALLREEPGVFLGYAVGLTDTTGFAPSGSTAYPQCSGAPRSRLMAQIRGRITFTDGTLTNVRDQAGVSGAIIAQKPEGATFVVQTGPSCVDGYAWWGLTFDDGTFGYVAEGIEGSYFLEPWQ